MMTKSILVVLSVAFSACFASAQETPVDSMTDAQLSKKYQNDYRTLSNELRRTHISKFIEDKVISDFKDKFANLKKVVDSLKDPKYKTPFAANYTSLEKWFNKKVASANKQKKQHLANNAARDEAEKKRKQQAEKNKPGQQTTTVSKTLDYQNKRALQFFNKDYQRYQADFQKIDPAKLDVLDGYISRLDNRFSKITAKKHPDVVKAESNLNALKEKLNAVKKSRPANALSKEDEAVHKEFQKLYQKNRVAYAALTPADLSNPIEAKYWGKILKQFDNIVKKFKNLKTPVVKSDIKQLEKIRKKINSGLKASESLSLANYPTYKQDLDFLNNLYKKYSKTNIFSEKNEALAKKLMSSYENDKKALDKLKKQYAGFIKGNATANAPNYKVAGNMSRNMRNASDWFSKFEQAQKTYIENAVPDIEKLLKKTQDMVDQAVKEKRTAWFTGGGIQHNMTRTESRLNSFAVIKGEKNPQVKQLKVKFTKLSKDVKKAEETLKEEILASQKMPANAYRGRDKNTITSMAAKEWRKKHPGKPILAKGIAMPNWDRKTEWRYGSVDGKRYKVDRSSLQVWVIVKTDNLIATQYIVEFSKNHTKRNKITINAPANLQGNVFKTEMLLKNVR
jgi:hypothetical protein